MSITIYHNPRCSKSRQTLALIEERGLEPDIVKYLESPPDAETILDIAARLGIPVSGLLRRKEAAFRDASDVPSLDNDRALAQWLSANPIVIERPIVLAGNGQARIGRPPENVLEIL